MKKVIKKERNWFLVFICIILMVIGAGLVLVSVNTFNSFGWWSLLFAASGLVTIVAATMSIIKNDASWILLDLIIPG